MRDECIIVSAFVVSARESAALVRGERRKDFIVKIPIIFFCSKTKTEPTVNRLSKLFGLQDHRSKKKVNHIAKLR